MAYKTVDSKIYDTTINVADRNNMAIAGGYTGLDDFNTNGPKSPSAGGGSVSVGSGGARTDFVQGLYNTFNEQDAARKSATKAAQDKLIAYYASLKDPTQRYTELRTANGVDTQQSLVDALTGNVMDTEKLITDLEPSVNARSTDFFINDADRTALLARERDPLQKQLTTLLGQKQREEVGLAGKQALVQELLQLSLLNDERQAKPLQLGVDYSTNDEKTARDIFASMAATATSAFSADQSAAETAANLKSSQEFTASQNKEKFANDITLENLRTSNDIAKTTATTEKNDAAKKKAQKTTDLFNNILGSAKNEYDVWKKIWDNRTKWAAEGYDVDKLWSMHSALKAQIGKGAITSSAKSSLSELSSLLQ